MSKQQPIGPGTRVRLVKTLYGVHRTDSVYAVEDDSDEFAPYRYMLRCGEKAIWCSREEFEVIE